MILETVLTARNLLSPELAKAARDVTAFNSTVIAANEKAAASAAASSRAQQSAATNSAASQARASTAATVGAGAQSAAADKIAVSNVKASTSAQASAASQQRAHAKAAESASLSARVQQSANNSLAASNGLLGTSLTPLTAGLGAVALGLGYAAYSGMTFDKSMSRVAAASQASTADLGRLRQAALDAGADTQYSAEEAAQGITELSKAGVSTADVLGGGLTGALNLAAAGEMEVAEAAETTATALSVFRLEGSQAGHVADLLAAGAGKAQGSVHDMGAALNQSALVAAQAGLSIEDTTGALAMFASNGLLGSDAGTSFKTMLQALTPNSVAAAKAMDAIGFSAYDAQGNFVGMESVAGQLRTGLAGLTEEQRNTTLETIFGSDAVRAASVFYKEGATGVAEWAGKVDDAGFAARQAAENNNNLAGDLEKLQGAAKNVFTVLGGGAQGALREVVQGMTAVVDAGGDVIGFFTDLPGPVQVAIGTLGAVALLKGPVIDSVKGIGFAIDVMRASAVNAGGAMGVLKGGASGLVGVLGGPWAIAAAAAVGGTMLLADAFDDTALSTDYAASSLTTLTSALEQSKGAIDDTVRAAAAKDLVNSGLTEWADKIGVSLPVMTDALLGVPSAMDEVTGAFNRYAGANKTWISDESGYSAQVLNDQGMAAENARDGFLGLSGQVEDTADKQRQYAEAAESSSASQAGAASATELLADQFASNKETVDAAKQAVDDYKLALDILTGAHVSMIEVESSFEAALASADGALKDMNGTVLNASGGLNMQSESGRAAADVLLDVKDSGNQLIATMQQQGATTDDVRARDAQLRESFIRTAEQMGISRGDAERLADQILGIPSERETRILADVTPAEAALNRLIGNYNGKTLTIDVATRIAKGATINSLGLAEGGVLGAGESHVAQIAPAGAWRVWAEPETGGEAYIPLAASKRDRSLNIWRETGKRLDAPEAQYFANGGLNTSDYMSRMFVRGSVNVARADADVRGIVQGAAQAIVDSAGAAGGDSIAGTGWQPIWNYVKARVPQARINSTYRPGDPGRHGRGLAVDFGFGSGPGGAGSAGLALINRVLHDGIGSTLAELIYDGIGDDRPDLRGGRPHTYSRSTQLEHANHVHAAREHGGPVWPGQDFLVGERGPELARFDAPATVYPNGTSPAAMPGYGAGAGFGGGAVSVAAPNVVVHARVFVGNREITDIARVEAETVVIEAEQMRYNQQQYNG